MYARFRPELSDFRVPAGTSWIIYSELHVSHVLTCFGIPLILASVVFLCSPLRRAAQWWWEMIRVGACAICSVFMGFNARDGRRGFEVMLKGDSDATREGE